MQYLNSDDLLKIAPWLAKYGGRLLSALARCRISRPEDILSVNPDEFATRPGVGTRLRLLLEQAQEELRQRMADAPTAGATGMPITADTDLLHVPWFRNRYPTRLLHSLGRLGLSRAGEVLQLAPEEFGRAWGVGVEQVRALSELQAELGAVLRGGAAPPTTGTPPTPPEPEVDAPLTSDLQMLPECAQVPVSSIWHTWDLVPATLRNSLARHGLLTVADVLRTPPARFAGLAGVGVRRVRELIELQGRLREWIARQTTDPTDHAEAVSQKTDETCASGGSVIHVKRADTLEELLAEVVRSTCGARRGAVDAERDSELWLGHFGIGVDKALTLEELGNAHGITRERVRQIVSAVTRQVRQEFRLDPSLDMFLQKLDALFQRCLGVAEVDAFGHALQTDLGWRKAPSIPAIRALATILEGSPRGFAVDRGDGLIRHVDMCQTLWQRAATRSRELLHEIGDGCHLLDYIFRVSVALQNGCSNAMRRVTVVPCCGAASGEASLPELYVRALLSTLDPCPLDGDRVLGYWHAVLRNGRVKRQVVHAALRVLGRPTHYKNLTDFIVSHNAAFSAADERYVHGCLVNSDEYILTAELGTYGLREWGVTPYLTVADRIEQFLRQRKYPLPLKEIVRVFRDQGVPENNVRTCLRQRRFHVAPDGVVRLSEWPQEGKSSEDAEQTIQSSPFLYDDEDPFLVG